MACGPGSVPDDLAREERRHPAFVVSWLLATLVHNGVVDSPGLAAPYPKQRAWLHSASQLPVARELDECTKALVNAPGYDIETHRKTLGDIFKVKMLFHTCTSLVSFAMLCFFWTKIHHILVPNGNAFYLYWPDAWRPDINAFTLSVIAFGTTHNLAIIKRVFRDAAKFVAHARNTNRILRHMARRDDPNRPAPRPEHDAETSLTTRLLDTCAPFRKGKQTPPLPPPDGVATTRLSSACRARRTCDPGAPASPLLPRHARGQGPPPPGQKLH